MNPVHSFVATLLPEMTTRSLGQLHLPLSPINANRVLGPLSQSRGQFISSRALALSFHQGCSYALTEDNFTNSENSMKIKVPSVTEA